MRVRTQVRKTTRQLVSSTTYALRKNPACLDSILVKENTWEDTARRKEQLKKLKFEQTWKQLQSEMSNYKNN
jgi:hypothetical protein